MSLPGGHGLLNTNLDLSEVEPELISTSYQAYSTYDTLPISKLPNEILSSIFLIDVEASRVFSIRCEARESTISASQVCRRWRAVALNCAILWTSIMDFESDSYEWTQELLVRTKQVPFDVGSSRASCMPKNLNLVLDLCPRWKTFHLEVETLTEELLHAIQKPAPHLEMFGILLEDDWEVTTLPKTLFNETAPKLREVRLNQCCFDITTSVFSQLTSLDVLWDDGFVGPTVSEWLNLLNNIPQLRKLLISKAVSTSTSTEPLPRVELPHLSDLGVGAPLAECSRFLSHIDIPPLKRFSLTTYELRPHRDFQAVLKFLEERVDGWARNTVNNKCHAGLWPYSFWVSSGSPYPQDPFDSSIQVTFDWEGFLENELTDATILFAHPFIKLFSPLLHNARSLHMYYQDDVDDDLTDSVPTMTLVAVSLLHPFYNLVTLHLSGDVHITLFPFLERVHVVWDPLGRFGLMLPSLQCLEFSNNDFKKDDENGLKALRAFLQFRSDNGIAIKKIKFNYCNLDERQENTIKEFGIDISSAQPHDFQFEW